MFAGDEVRSSGNSTHYNFTLLYLLSKQWISRSNLTVTMPIYEYEQLESKADGFDCLIRMLERANQDGKAVMTDELRTKIEEIFC